MNSSQRQLAARQKHGWSPTFFLGFRHLAVLPIHAYTLFISPLLGTNCRFYPSCSAYATEAIMTHGVCRGVWLALVRILRCNPWSAGGVDPVPPAVKSLSSLQEHPGHHGN